MDYNNILFDVQENVVVLKFNRPKALNAVNPEVFHEMNDALRG